MLRQISQLGHPVCVPRCACDFSSVERDPIAGCDMLETIRDANGIGIAAPRFLSPCHLHRGLPADPRYPDAPSMEPEVVINPEIIELSPEVVKDWEGCLSIPGLRGEVPGTATSGCDIRRSTARSSSVDLAISWREFSSTKTTISTGSSFSTGSKAPET